MNREPLVSVLVPNYNYSSYLKQCLESIMNQTYKNIEVIFRDNNSQDNSYEIAVEYEKKMREHGIYMFCGKNKRNMGSAGNTSRCYAECEGEYVIYLSSDDAMEPTYIEKCVAVMEKNPNVGMVMVHRKAMDKDGNIEEEIPFYNKNCIIPKESQAAVFMMAGIAIPSQIMMRKSVLDKIYGRRLLVMQVASDWLENFMMSMYADVAYLKEPLCLYRTHNNNETTGSERNLVGIFEHYLLVNAFVWISQSFGMNKPAERYDEAVKKLANMCMRYALKMLNADQFEAAEKYLMLAPVFDKSILEVQEYKDLQKCITADQETAEDMLKQLQDEVALKRRVSYDPPEDAVEIQM